MKNFYLHLLSLPVKLSINLLRNLKLNSCCFITILYVMPFFAHGQQNGTIIGTVSDAITNEPLVGVNILVAGTSMGTSTDEEGTYALEVPAGSHTISASFIGYVTIDKSVNLSGGEAITLDFKLPEGPYELTDVIIVGSRNVNRSVLETPVPVDIIPMDEMTRIVPQIDVNQILTYVAPSFQANRQSASDATEFVDPASLRGLGPDQVLVLINGKRRHTTSLVNNQQTVGNGAVGTDMNAIPTAAIERIEILRDGASAQYGSDAIAGVINIVLKSETDELTSSFTGGVTSEGDGETVQLNANYGFRLGERGFFNITGEYTNRERTNRTDGNNLIIFDQSALGNFFAYDFTDDPAASRAFDDAEIAARGLERSDFNFRVGNAEIQNAGAFFNAVFPLNEEAELYAFGGLNFKNGIGAPFRRLPSDFEVSNLTIFPNGYQPELHSAIEDKSIAIGLRGKIKAWNVDFSNTFGENSFDFRVENTLNASLLQASPTSFEAGGHSFSQNTTNLHFTRFYRDVLEGINVAFGIEYRVENYEILAGEEASFRNFSIIDTVIDGRIQKIDVLGKAGGSQGFPGFRPENEVNEFRSNIAVYIDGEFDLMPGFMVGLAGRFEDYSDFGNTFNGKVTSRLSLTEILAIRGSFSTGFRAPSLHQIFFNTVSTDLSGGLLTEVGTFSNDSQVARVLGIAALEEETSVSGSLGFTLSPLNNFRLTVDGYIINVDDRVVLTGDFGEDPFGDPDPEIQELLSQVGANVARFFSNAIDTETRGLDVIATYETGLGVGTLGVTVAANFNETEVVGDLNIPASLEGREETFFGTKERTLIEKNNPKSKINITGTYSINNFTGMARVVRFGEVTRDESPFGMAQVHDPKWVTDLSLSYQLTPQFNITIGGNNIFDVFPDRQIFDNSFLGVFNYAPVQMGFNGAYFFGRVGFRL